MRLSSCALWTSLQTSMSNVPKNEKREWNETAKRSKQVISWNKLLAHKFHICHWRKSKSGQQAVSRDRDLPSVCFSIECPPFDILSIMSQLKSCFTFKLLLSHEIEMFVVCHFQSLSFSISFFHFNLTWHLSLSIDVDFTMYCRRYLNSLGKLKFYWQILSNRCTIRSEMKNPFIKLIALPTQNCL